MKGILTICYLSLLSSALILSSCRKTVDCVLEGTFTSVSATVDAANVKQYTFSPNYYGSHEVTKVDWDFGDGQKQTTLGKESVTHVYTTSGTKVVKASINTKIKKSTCTISPEKTINVE